ncbi:MAG: glycosyltransferase family 4 protein, partial [Bacteroidales bacterium]
FNTYELPSEILPGVLDKLSLKSFLSLLKKLGVMVKDIATIHTHVTGNGIYANTLKKLNPNIKTILQHHGFDVLSITNGRFANYGWHKKYIVYYGSRICNKIDLHVVVSAKTLSYIQQYKEITLKESYILYNGVDKTKFYKLNNPRADKIFKIGCVGNFWEIKCQIILIKAIELLIGRGENNIYTSFIGTGYMMQECMDYVESHNMQKYISFEKEVSHKELNEYYNSLDLFVLPSYYEAFGCVYTEAYACGVPFIAVDGQGISELIFEKDRDKWLINKGNFVSLANKIESFKRDRYEQVLKTSIEINTLVIKFLDYIRVKAEI